MRCYYITLSIKATDVPGSYSPAIRCQIPVPVVFPPAEPHHHDPNVVEKTFKKIYERIEWHEVIWTWQQVLYTKFSKEFVNAGSSIDYNAVIGSIKNHSKVIEKTSLAKQTAYSYSIKTKSRIDIELNITNP